MQTLFSAMPAQKGGYGMDNYIITIARGFGSGGKQIGLRLSKRLGIPCYEKQILQMASDYSGINKSLFVKSDEKLNGKKIAMALKKFPKINRLAEPNQKDFVSDVNLFNIQAEMIRELAKTESCIIIGKCANYILKDFDNVVSVYVEASRRACRATIMDRLDVTAQEADQMIYQTDKYRSDYYSYYTGGGKWTDPVAYDMTLNSERIGYDDCADLIIHYKDIKLARRSDS